MWEISDGFTHDNKFIATSYAHIRYNKDWLNIVSFQ